MIIAGLCGLLSLYPLFFGDTTLSMLGGFVTSTGAHTTGIYMVALAGIAIPVIIKRLTLVIEE